MYKDNTDDKKKPCGYVAKKIQGLRILLRKYRSIGPNKRRPPLEEQPYSGRFTYLAVNNTIKQSAAIKK